MTVNYHKMDETVNSYLVFAVWDMFVIFLAEIIKPVKH